MIQPWDVAIEIRLKLNNVSHLLERAKVRFSRVAMSMLGGYGGYGALGGSMGFGTMPMAAPQMMTSQRMVDVPVPHVQTRHVPRVETQIVDRHVPRVEVQTVERVVEVPQVRVALRCSQLAAFALSATCFFGLR